MTDKIRPAGLLMALAVMLLNFTTSSANDDHLDLAAVESWRDLKPTASLPQPDGMSCYQFQLGNGSKADLVVARLSQWLLRPIVRSSTGTTSSSARLSESQVAVNGGYFNLSDGESASYVIIDGKVVCDPRENKALTSNPKLKPYLEAIFNRSEIRVLRDMKGQMVLDIAPHNQAVQAGETLVHSLQAGPELLPNLTDRKEAFVRIDADGKEVEAIGSHKAAARTAVGITSDRKYIMLICVQGKKQDEFSSGVSLAELAGLLKKLGCSNALNLDGGTSTTMVVRAAANIDRRDESKVDVYKMVCGKVPETKVRSVLALKAAAPD